MTTRLTALPSELLFHIFSNLSQTDLYACIQVSHHFYSLALPLLWRCPWSVSTASWRALVRTLESKPSISDAPFDHVRILNLHQLAYVATDPLLQKLLPACKRLTSFALCAPRQTSSATFQLLGQCSHLKFIRLHRCRYVTDECLLRWSQLWLAPRIIDLSLCKNVSDRGVAALIGACMLSLTQIILAGCIKLSERAFQAYVQYNDSLLLPLVYLDVTGCDGVTDQVLWELIQKTELLHLIADECPLLTGMILEKCLNELPKERLVKMRVSVRHCPNVNDAIVQHWKRIRRETAVQLKLPLLECKEKGPWHSASPCE